ncbi:MAG: glycerol-3-phosphate dehydrogenase [Herpetosiphonaceae bacterium]|nr:glycerol-3-phosphate dehydrogenase [Herpetosiphonaceae bacterium]
MARIAVLGAGVMGTALTYPLADNGHEVHLIGTHLDEELIAACRTTGAHPGLNSVLPPNVRCFPIGELDEALDGIDVIALGVNSRGVHWAGQILAPHLRPGQPVIMVTKGLAADADGALCILPDLLSTKLPPSLRGTVPIAAIGGPSIAAELAARRPTCVVFTCSDTVVLDYLAGLFVTDYYQIWTSTDMIGVEVCVALKNLYALGVGLVPGLLEKANEDQRVPGATMHNFAAALFAQGLVETARLVQLLGGSIESVFSLPGAGDLYVTCQGGRNSRMGRLLGLGLTPAAAAGQLAGETIEGVDAVKVIAPAIEQLIRRGVLEPDAFPLLRQIYGVAVEGRPFEASFDRFFQPATMAVRSAAGVTSSPASHVKQALQ